MLLGWAVLARQHMVATWPAMNRTERSETMTEQVYWDGKWHPRETLRVRDADEEIPFGTWYVDVLDPTGPYNVMEGPTGRSMVRWRLSGGRWQMEAIYFESIM